MGMRDDDGSETAFGFDLIAHVRLLHFGCLEHWAYEVYRVIVEKRNQIPHHIALIGLDKKGSLADGELQMNSNL